MASRPGNRQGDRPVLTQLIQDRTAASTCVWMDAGLLTYKLCDRNFDCEHCPLDAALRGAPVAPTFERADLSLRTSEHGCPPRDRVHCAGHTWLKRLAGGGVVRLGIDRFAASLLPTPTGVRCLAPPRFIPRCQPVCEIVSKSGGLVLASPIAGHLARWNDALTTDPSLLIADPYDDGWIAELWPLDDSDLPEPDSPSSAEQQERLDLRRFIRRVGQELLLGSTPPAGLNSNGCAGTDLRSLMDGERFMHVLAEFIH